MNFIIPLPGSYILQWSDVKNLFEDCNAVLDVLSMPNADILSNKQELAFDRPVYMTAMYMRQWSDIDDFDESAAFWKEGGEKKVCIISDRYLKTAKLARVYPDIQKETGKSTLLIKLFIYICYICFKRSPTFPSRSYVFHG